MVFKRSEYRKQYRDPIWDSHFSHYKEKVDYRIHRRCMEHHHQIFDWDWDSENGDDEGGRPSTAPNLNSNNRAGQQRRQGMERNGKEVLDREVQTPEWSRMSAAPPGELRGQMVGGDLESSPRLDGQPVQRDVGQIKDCKPVQPARKHNASRNKRQSQDRRRARPSTSPGKRVATTKVKADYPPLVAFGWADREMTTGGKKTHNIRASADPLQIYPSALRAMRRRELDIQRQTEKGSHQNLKEQKLKAMFNIQPRDDSVWLTEYRQNFTGPSQPR